MELEGLVTECGGLDTVATAVLGGLSPGQCQRLAIARLFLRGPKLAMIDEGACWPPLKPPLCCARQQQLPAASLRLPL